MEGARSPRRVRGRSRRAPSRVATAAARERGRLVPAVVLAATLIAGCQNMFPPQRTSGPALARAVRRAALAGNELDLTIHRLGEAPEEVETSAHELTVRVFYDPDLVSLPLVDAYKIWSRAADESEWRLAATCRPIETTATVGFDAAKVGLYASVVYRDGSEAYKPRPGAPPALWVHTTRDARGARVAEEQIPAVASDGPTPPAGEPARGDPASDGTEADRAPDDAPAGRGPAASSPSSPSSPGGGAPPPPPGRTAGAPSRDADPGASDALAVTGATDAAEPDRGADLDARAGTTVYSSKFPGLFPDDPAARDGQPEAAAGVDGAERIEPSSGSLRATEPPDRSRTERTGVADVRPFEGGVAEVPVVVLERLPESVGEGLTLLVSVSDPNRLGIDRVEAWLRPAGATSWRQLPHEASALDGESLSLELGALSDGEYELLLRAVDRGGNARAAPDASTAPAGRFRLDKTAPRLVARPSSLDWVEGLPASIQLDLERGDAVPPVLFEGREPVGAWKELARFPIPETDAPGVFAVPIPVGVGDYSVRASVADARGNVAEALIGPRTVEPSLRVVADFAESKVLTAGKNMPITWELHPLAATEADSLRVSVWHQRSASGPWSLILDRVTADSASYWDLPPFDEEEHRLRLRLHREDDSVLGETFSAWFRLAPASETPPAAPPIATPSREHLEQATSLLERYDAAVALSEDGVDNARDVAELKASVLREYRKAIEVDPNNYKATYALALFLNRVEAGTGRDEVRSLLERTIETQPHHFWALNDVGAVYIQDERYADAERVLNRAVKERSTGIVHYNLALALFYQRKWEAARAQLDAALVDRGDERVPEGEIYFYYVHAYLQAGELDAARKLFEEKAASIPADLRRHLAESL